VPAHRIPPARLLVALAAAAALPATGAALAADEREKSVTDSRAASASASAYQRQDDSARRGYVTISGNGSKRGDGTSVSASTSGGNGSAKAAARAREVALFGDLVTADLVSASATASAAGDAHSGRVRGLFVDGRRIGPVDDARSFRMGGYGRLDVLEGSGGKVTGLSARLTRAYGSYPAGATVRVAYARASASDAVAEPEPEPRPEPEPDEQDEPGRDADDRERDADAGKPDKPERREAPRTRTLATSKGFVFPVAGKYSYSNDWGAPRQNTGTHEGNDIFASAGTPAVAVCDGTLHRVGTNVVPGNRLWVKCDKGGDAFFYAHLAAFANGTRSGADIKAGEVVGFVGSTGDAEQTPPHVHFEVHPGGWGNDAVNPYPFLRAWEQRRDVPEAAWAQGTAGAGQQPGTLVVVRDFLDR
jgi:murein DD-endopeptidase MepM/ murein hydrolase activator NlpD